MKNDGKYGVVDRNGDSVTQIDFDHLETFSHGFAVARRGHDVGFIDQSGNFAIDVIPVVKIWLAANRDAIGDALQDDAKYRNVYIGRVFEAKAGVFGFTNKFVITGINRQTGKVTIRSNDKDESGEYFFQEIDSDQVPN